MRPTQILRGGGGGPLGKYGHYLGTWGDLGSPLKQRGIISYGLAPNRQNPFAGAAHAAIFNTFRRTRHQILYWLPPAIAAYYIMEWAHHKNHYINSKEGRAEAGEEE